MANIRLKKGQVDPKNPQATSVTGPATLKTADIDSIQIEGRKGSSSYHWDDRFYVANCPTCKEEYSAKTVTEMQALEQAHVCPPVESEETLEDIKANWHSWPLGTPEVNREIGVRDTVTFRSREEEQEALDNATIAVLDVAAWGEPKTRADGSVYWLTPNPEHGAPNCACGNPMELREMKNGMSSWVHIDRPELNQYIDAEYKGYMDSEGTFSIDPMDDTADYERNLAILDLNAELGVGIQYGDRQTMEGYDDENLASLEQTNIGGGFGKLGDKIPFFNGDNRFIGRHSPEISVCGNCGNTTNHVEAERSGLFRTKTGYSHRVCSGCRKRVI